MVSGPFEGHTGRVSSIAFSPDGKYVILGSDDETICVWDAKEGNIVSGPFKGHTGQVSSVAFSPDGKHVVSGAWDNTTCIWDVEKGNTVSRPFEGHTDSVMSVAFSHDGKYVVSGSLDKTIHIWNVKESNMVPFGGHSVKDKLPLLSDGADISTWGDSLALSDDGWVHDIKFELLFWIPLQNRKGLVWPRTTAIMGVPVTVLDFSQFVHGSSWGKCLHVCTRQE